MTRLARTLQFMAALPLLATTCVAHEHVILLHGLCRTRRSMAVMEHALVAAGYCVVNVDYPSRSAPIAQLGERAIGPAIAKCQRDGANAIHFVTHSLGGILVRSYLATHTVSNLGRVVMLGPPNQGSEVVDRFARWKIFRLVNGPAGGELGTGSASTPNRLGAVAFELGVIAGDRSLNWINSCLIPGPDDGKVSIARTKVAGMGDHIVLAATHPFLMRNRAVIRQTRHFLRTGRFDHTHAAPTARLI